MESLREVGYRLTPQRMLIIAIIHDSKGHVTAEDVHTRVTEQYPFVDISTVYRTLQLLKKHGFQADMEHFAIFGVCRTCADKGQKG